MFNSSKYTTWYTSLISKAQNRKADFSGHKHHILPKSLGGDNSPENIVLLTYREHFIAHLLLVKMTSGLNRSKMAFALQRFGGKNVSGQTFALASSLISSSVSGAGNPMYGKALSDSHREKISGINHGMFGTYCKNIWISKYGEEKANELDSQMRVKRSISMSGENNPMFGKRHSQERKKHQSDCLSGEKHFNFGKPSFNKGKIWINDGKISLMIKITDLNEYPNFKKGRLPK